MKKAGHGNGLGVVLPCTGPKNTATKNNMTSNIIMLYDHSCNSTELNESDVTVTRGEAECQS